MPGNGLQEADKESIKRMLKVARSSKRLQQPIMDSYANSLSNEVQLEFLRSMAKILLDKTVLAQPSAFPFVTLPDPPKEVVRETGKSILRGKCKIL